MPPRSANPPRRFADLPREVEFEARRAELRDEMTRRGPRGPELDVTKPRPPASPVAAPEVDRPAPPARHGVNARILGPFTHGPLQKVMSYTPGRISGQVQNHHVGSSGLYLFFCEEREAEAFQGYDPADPASPIGAPGSVWIDNGELFTFDQLPAPYFCYDGPVWAISGRVTDDDEVFYYDGTFTITEYTVKGWGE